MALPPEENQTFVREVDEELRRAELLRIWRSYGLWIVVAVIAILVAIAVWLYLGHRSNSTADARGERYDQVVQHLNQGNYAKATPELAEIAKQGDGYAALARLEQAAILLQNNDHAGAAAKFAQIAADPSVPEPYRQLATIRRTYAEFDWMKPSEVIDRLKSLAVPESAWFGSAGELVALAYLKQGRTSEAGQLLNKIAQTESVPESIRQRVQQLAGRYGVQPAAETAADSESAATGETTNTQSEGNASQ
ncbi:tetratricopeptide repeat protein [Stakelama tenebrarum]|uniref:Ancillary SecYEG translocon subunit n=1 Tax=Stakelama tenebrarum TaxID=2711215 RepID=A0A6G6Y9H7_9SPHN|nr:tetratricopeptide repeat protein [Sphingosinithalassobacter tenebrarum]QIG81226.1 tetratricopeptide repeat protein [Sphingosinithalassobacter tenebrarum]